MRRGETGIKDRHRSSYFEMPTEREKFISNFCPREVGSICFQNPNLRSSHRLMLILVYCGVTQYAHVAANFRISSSEGHY